MDDPPNLISACRLLRRHDFLRSLDWHFDNVSVPGAVMHVVYEDPSDPSLYPSVSVEYEKEYADAVTVADQAQSLFSLASALCDNLIKAAIAIDEISQVSPETYLDIRRLDYHIENFYMRIPISLEHIYAIAACVFELPEWQRAPLWKLAKMVRGRSEAVASSIAPIGALIEKVRESRNEVAHTGEFSDSRLSGIRAHLTTSEMIFRAEFKEHHPQLYQALVRYQKEFIEESERRLLELKATIETALDEMAIEALPVLKKAEEVTRAAWSKDREDTDDAILLHPSATTVRPRRTSSPASQNTRGARRRRRNPD